MLIPLTVQSKNYTAVAVRDSLHRITSTQRTTIFESADLDTETSFEMNSY